MQQKLPEMSTKRRNRLDGWRNLTPELMMRLPEHIRNYIIAESEADARNQFAKERMAFFKSASKRRLSPSTENLSVIVSVIIGALTFSVAPQLLANQSGKGSLATPAGFVGGAALSYFAHANAAKALTERKLRRSTQQARQAIVQKEN